MAVKRTSTIKNKHAAGKTPKSGSSDGKSKSKSSGKPSAPLGRQAKGAKLADLLKKKKKKVYSEKELGIPQLNMVTPIGVTKPKGKKKGKVFVDDKVRCNYG
jgi:60S ribosomal subunit assembly/export protein LOC1